MSRLTFADLKGVVAHALGADPNTVWTDAATTKGHIVNQAGRYLFGMHQWSFRDRPPLVSINFVAGQPYVEVPFDFDGLQSIEVPSSITSSVTVVSLVELERLRSSVLTGVLNFHVAISYPTQQSADESPPLPRLELWPTPTADANNALRLLYRAGWLELVADTAVANIPIAYESLLVKMIVAFAKEQDDDREDAVNVIENSAMLRRLKQNDGMSQPFFGMPTGGIVRITQNGDFSPHDERTITTSG